VNGICRGALGCGRGEAKNVYNATLTSLLVLYIELSSTLISVVVHVERE
jgi:hypothetical protein